MVTYNPKDWFTFIFRFHKADTFRALFPMMIAIGIYSFIVAWVEIEYMHISKDNPLTNFSAMHSILGLVISLLLVFRTNTAYERWWEGRKFWGALVNSSRNLAIKLHPMLGEQHTADRFFFLHMIPNYAFALKNHLRNKILPEDFTHPEMLQPELEKNILHVPNRIARMLYERINLLFEKGIIKQEQLLVLTSEVQQFTEICGACERIKNTPIPFSYSSFIKKFIFFYIMTLPWGYVFSVGYLVIPIVVFIFYVLASLELIAE
ncbi:MAG: bestrophin family ion channel [Chitinophagales bacterium]|nr:bestrophin family ion channel [Chitinophagales bacterium]